MIKTRKLALIQLSLLSCRLYSRFTDCLGDVFRRGSPCHTLCLGVPSPPSISIYCPQSFFLCDIFQDRTQTVLLSGLSDIFPSGLSDVLHCGLFDVSSGFSSGWLVGHEATCPVSCAGLTAGSVGCHDDLFWVTLTDHLVRGGVHPN